MAVVGWKSESSGMMKENLPMTENIFSRRRFLGLMAASLPGISLIKGTGTLMAGETKNRGGG